MRSTSCRQIAGELLALCVLGKAPRELPPALMEEPCAQALFGILVEGLADRFEPALCDVYVRLLAPAVARAVEGLEPASLLARYERVRRPRPVTVKPRRIFVLSRVTLGADVAVTSVLMAAVKRRFTEAEIVFVGPTKNYELFARDHRLHHAPLNYCRGSLRERLAAGAELRQLVHDENSLLIDPDSRFTQLGLLPVCSEERYCFFESRAYGASSGRSLPELAAAWAKETFGIDGAEPFVALSRSPKKAPYTAVSFGVGENPSKRIPDPFEEELLAMLARRGHRLCVDIGAGGAEAERVRRAIERSGVQVSLWEGSFAGFASIIAGSSLYVGYDSAGQHVAAACGVPLITIFAGFPSLRMFQRWRPAGTGCHVIKVDQPDVGHTIQQVRESLAAVAAG